MSDSVAETEEGASASVADDPSAAEIRWARLAPWIASSVPLLFYLSAVHDRVTRGDVGELAGAAYRLGVTHPTGYPLFTLLGHLFTWLPLPLEAAGKLAVMCALFGAGAVWVTARLGSRMAGYLLGADDRHWFCSLPAAAAAMVYGLSPILYSQSRIVEVYSLHAFLMSMTFYLMFRFEETRERRYVSMAAIFMGLGLAHHMTTSQLLPAALVYILLRDRGLLISRYMIYGLLAGLGGASIYLYLPLADTYTSGFPWGGCSDPYFFFYHVSGSHYHHYLYESTETVWRHTKELPVILGSNLQFALPLFLLGLWQTIRRHPGWLLFPGLYLAAALTHLIGYNVGDYRVYYTAPLMVMSLFAAAGGACCAWWISNRLAKRKRWLVLGLYLLAMLVTAIIVAVGHWQMFNDEVPFARDYGNEVTTLPPAGSIILQRGDTHNYSGWYYQNVHDQGRDIAIINVLRVRDSWYTEWVHKRWPWLSFKQSRSPRQIVERTLENYLDQRRVFTRSLGERKRYTPRGPYKLICRGYIHEFIRTEHGHAVSAYLSEALLSDEVRDGRARRVVRSFTTSDPILLAFRWLIAPNPHMLIEWVAPSGKVIETRKVDRRSQWISMKTNERPAGAWQVRGSVNGELLMELDFVVREE